ncbi:activator-dependent family glycosyltransferase [Nocardiopsis deserti]|uniref:activator-dependent family glycosyltransferase n=1 Tax=Nocardiopsis deserti TaxID=2605988 RepID=UPI001238FC1A|nr:activator-dependent family glycosyltransferase [Nocardiopsis deserti]
MRILFATISERTHFIGAVPLAWAFRSAGHEVLVASQPELGPVVRATGLPFAQVGKDHLLAQIIALGNRTPGGGEFGFDMAEVAREPGPGLEALHSAYRDSYIPWWWRLVNDPMTNDLVDLCRAWRPDLVVWEPITYSGAIAAEACGARHVRHLWSLDLFAALRHLFLERLDERSEEGWDDPLRSWLEHRAARQGVDFSEALVTGHASIDYLPPSLDVPLSTRTSRLRTRYVPYNGRAVVPNWLRTPPDRPRIGLSLGTTATQRMGGYTVDVGAVLEGLADLDAEVVATLPATERERLGTVPPNTRLVDYVPLHALAPTCAAMITHGGTGTVLSGLAHGVPQVTIPHQMYDEVLVASALEESGGGLTLSPESATPESVRDAVGSLLTEARYAEAGARLRNEIARMPSPADLALKLVDA